jgi:L-rhamnose mutarotase
MDFVLRHFKVRPGFEDEVRELAASGSDSEVIKLHSRLGLRQETVFLREEGDELLLFIVLEVQDIDSLQDQIASSSDPELAAMRERMTKWLIPQWSTDAAGVVTAP